MRGQFRRAHPSLLDELRKEGQGYEYDVVDLDAADELRGHYLLKAEEIGRIQLAGLDRHTVAQKLHALQDAAEAAGLVVTGYMSTTNLWIRNFKAGPVMLEPNPAADLPHDTQFKLWYTSWDGWRRRDVTEMSNEDFVTFMSSEPEQLTQISRPPE